MSYEITQTSQVTSISHRFVLTWILKGKDLNNLSKKEANESVIKSHIHQFKSDKDLQFYLEIKKTRYYHISIKGSKMWCFELSYAFIVYKEKAYYLKLSETSNDLSFLPEGHDIKFLDEEDVPIHCLVIADPVFSSPSSSPTKGEASPTDEDDLSPNEGQTTVDIECKPDIAIPGGCGNKVIIDFIRRGDIPNFNVDKAIRILRDLKEYKCEVLKILSVQYLMRNINSENVRQISLAAINYDLPFLERACLKKIVTSPIYVAHN